MKSLTDFSGSSGVCSGMTVKTKLSLMLRDFKSGMLSFMALFCATMEVSRAVRV